MHLIVWEFRVSEAHRRAFELAYGRRGDWVKPFAKGEGYAGTDLLRDRADPSRCVTIDRWYPEEAYNRFMRRFREACRVLDRRVGWLPMRNHASVSRRQPN